MASLKRAESGVENIESLTHRRVTIETELNHANLSKCNLQHQSPLFTFPLEIREFIWQYATEPFDNPDPASLPEEDNRIPRAMFHSSGEFYEPEYHTDHLSCTALLQTCRRVWLETNRLPLEQAKLSCAFPFGSDRMKPFRPVADGKYLRLEDFLLNLTPNNHENFAHITMLIHQFPIEHVARRSEGGRTGCEKVQGSLGPCPRMLTISARQLPTKHHNFGPDAPGWKRWVGMLLEFPASPRLQEISIEIDVSDWKAERYDRTMGPIRETYGIVRKVDQFGQPVTMLMDEEVRERKWQMPPVEYGKKERRLVTFTWRISPAPDSGGTRKRKHSTGLTHDCGSSLPLLAVDLFGDVGQKSASGSEEERLVEQYEQRWETEGSLLKFVRGVNK